MRRPAVARTERATAPVQRRAVPVQRQQGHDIGHVPLAAPNRTGLPDTLKSGVERLSGMSMDRVRVHYGSAEPARLNAHAFTRGTDIHLAPGQERHLPHEAWHVVQQSQGRVRPTRDVAGAQINDDGGLEREADRMGDASAAHGLAAGGGGGMATPAPAPVDAGAPAQRQACVQRVIKIKDGDLAGLYETKGGKDTKKLIDTLDKEYGKKLKRGWKTKIGEMAAKPDRDDNDNKLTFKYVNSKHFRKWFLKRFERSTLLDDLKGKKKKIRPNFPQSSYEIGAMAYGLQTGKDESDLKPSEKNLALPHRFPYAAIQNSTEKFITGKETATDLDRWSERLLVATQKRYAINYPKLKKKNQPYYKKIVNKQIKDFGEARTNLKNAVAKKETLTLLSPVVQSFLKITNALHGNIPDFGKHNGVNIQVSDRLHLHANDDGTLTPGSEAAGNMTPTRVPKGLAYTKGKGYMVTTDGKKVKVSSLQKQIYDMLKKHNVGETTIEPKELQDQPITFAKTSN